jgi:hypothetical protein
MTCGSDGWHFANDDAKDRYISEFTLDGDPRPKDADGRYLVAYPGQWLRPCSFERSTFGRALNRCLGVYLLRDCLKRFDCYPKTIRGTRYGTIDRRRALIATIPMTIGYEVPHTKTGFIHFIAALAVSLPFIIRNHQYDVGSDRFQMFMGFPLLVLNLVVIYAIDVMPVLVQRANRAELYNAIERESQPGYGTFDTNNKTAAVLLDAEDIEHYQDSRQIYRKSVGLPPPQQQQPEMDDLHCSNSNADRHK